MRLFIACALPEGLVDTLTAAQRVLEGQAHFIRLAGIGQLHLTLRFIGETEDGMVQTIASWFKMQPVPMPAVLQVRLSEYGIFAKGNGQLIWAGLSCRTELLYYVRSLEEDLRGLGLSPEWRQWLPHVTLARRMVLRCPFEGIQSLLPLNPRAFPLSAPKLYQSSFTPDGMRYSPI